MKTPPSAAPSHDTGLGAMLAAAQKGDHVVLADWIEEHLRLDDLAACLRQGQDDPRTAKQKEDQTMFTGFRYRQLDALVLLFVVKFAVHEWATREKKTKPPEGHAIGLCLSADAPKGPTRLVRWLTSATKCDALERLWDDLGRGRPAECETAQ